MMPRYTPTWAANDEERFIGMAGEVDVWLDDRSPDFVYVVGPPERMVKAPGQVFNFDGHEILNNKVDWDRCDVHLELHEMCQIMQLLVEEGKINVAA